MTFRDLNNQIMYLIGPVLDNLSVVKPSPGLETLDNDSVNIYKRKINNLSLRSFLADKHPNDVTSRF